MYFWKCYVLFFAYMLMIHDRCEVYSFLSSLKTSGCSSVFCFFAAGPNPPVDPKPPAPRVVSSRSYSISWGSHPPQEGRVGLTSTCCNRGTEIRSRIICAIRSFGLTISSAQKTLVHRRRTFKIRIGVVKQQNHDRSSVIRINHSSSCLDSMFRC